MAMAFNHLAGTQTRIEIMATRMKLIVVALCIGVIAMIWLLGGMLTPFVISAYLAYLGNPLVRRLMSHHIPRPIAVSLVFVTIFLILFGLWLLLVPLIEDQLNQFITQLPAMLNWIVESTTPTLEYLSKLTGEFDLATVKSHLLGHSQQAGGIISHLIKTIADSSNYLLAFVINLLLIPIVTFYFLRDWDLALKNQHFWLEVPVIKQWLGFIAEIDQILKAFFRGQFLLMVALAVIYSVALTVIGLPMSLLIGLLAGLLTIVPYLGFIIGIVLASLVALMQFHDLNHLLYVWGIFAGVAVIENVVLVPRLVGNSLGLHPVAVIFALSAGGQLFGLVGVLLALPVAAIIKVALRHLSLYVQELVTHQP
jgi:predicted PurR-regulated permease PerM